MAAGLWSIVLSKITAAPDDDIDSIFRYPHNRNTERFRVVTEPMRISAPSHSARDKAPPDFRYAVKNIQMTAASG